MIRGTIVDDSFVQSVACDGAPVHEAERLSGLQRQ
jgi:hypothetical protein